MAERARKLFAGPIDFLKSAPGLEYLPDPDVSRKSPSPAGRTSAKAR